MCENASGARASVAASEAARGSHFTQSMVKFAAAGLALGAATAAYGRFVELNNFQDSAYFGYAYDSGAEGEDRVHAFVGGPEPGFGSEYGR